jgi:serine phosphatase RsbU (regulator of sigma subunit)
MSKILVVEDEPGIALDVEDTLRLEGHDVEIVDNGETASRRLEEQKFDLILLDVMLPGKDGFDVCRELRRVDQNTPVILLTGMSRERDRIYGLDAGANDYVTKPFSPKELAARVRSLLRYTQAHRRNQERLEEEIRAASEVQQNLFPKSEPSVPGLDYSGLCRPALGVSGDYFDFIRINSQRLALLVADVSGKGMPAALSGASLHGAIRAGLSAGFRCGEVLARANRLLFEKTTFERFATVFLAVYDARQRTFTYSNAGHYPPALMRGTSHERLGALTPPLGIFQEIEPAETVIEMRPDDWLLIASDGIPDASNEAGEEFGDPALLAMAARDRFAKASQLCNYIIEAATTFSNGLPNDDMTIVAAHMLGQN